MSVIFGFGFVALTTVKLERFSGSHFDVGVQQGRAVRESMREALGRMPSFEVMKLMRPRFVPASVFLALAKRRAAKLLRDDIFEYYPKMSREL